MATINEIRRERRKAYFEIRRQAKAIDTRVEALRRQINRIISRKTKVPEAADLEETYAKLQGVNQTMNEFVKLMQQTENIFGI